MQSSKLSHRPNHDYKPSDPANSRGNSQVLDTSLVFFTWYDPSTLPLTQKIQQAMTRYKEKHEGRNANYCLVSQKLPETVYQEVLAGELGIKIELCQYLGLDTIYLTELAPGGAS